MCPRLPADGNFQSWCTADAGRSRRYSRDRTERLCHCTGDVLVEARKQRGEFDTGHSGGLLHRNQARCQLPHACSTQPLECGRERDETSMSDSSCASTCDTRSWARITMLIPLPPQASIATPIQARDARPWHQPPGGSPARKRSWSAVRSDSRASPPTLPLMAYGQFPASR